jgi:isopentenyl-diphosphate delta-isomerase
MSRKEDAVELRKAEHIEICLNENVETNLIETGFNDINLIHRALPEINGIKISLETKFLGKKFSAPIIINAMTGGTEKAFRINRNLAEAAEQLGVGLVVGSQRAALLEPKLSYTFKITREKAPNIFLAANIGAQQIKGKEGVKLARKAVEMINADALSIHLNPLHEAVQIHGETSYKNVIEKLKTISKDLNVPVIVKETGCGIAAEEAAKIEESGVKAIDIGGAGGTSFAKIEYYRAKLASNKKYERFGKTFEAWGIPTVISLVEVKNATKLPIIASGGVRSGLEAAKAIALGASLVGVAKPFLKPASISAKAVAEEIEMFTKELKTTMFLTGTDNLEKLSSLPVIITGKTREWLKARGINPDKYARRKRF